MRDRTRPVITPEMLAQAEALRDADVPRVRIAALLDLPERFIREHLAAPPSYHARLIARRNAPEQSTMREVATISPGGEVAA